VAENIVQVTEGSGKKLHTWDTTIGANLVQDEFTIPGQNPYATYIANIQGASGATANDHLLCVNAGASLKVRVLRVRIDQRSGATAASIAGFQLVRTTTGAPTGGTAVTPAPFDTADAASGAAGRSLPTVKGTETTVLMDWQMVARQVPSTSSAQADDFFEWTPTTWGKPIIIPTGTTNGLVVKNGSAVAGVTWNVQIEFIETAF
jgi:hypothetical protein